MGLSSVDGVVAKNACATVDISHTFLSALCVFKDIGVLEGEVLVGTVLVRTLIRFGRAGVRERLVRASVSLECCMGKMVLNETLL